MFNTWIKKLNEYNISNYDYLFFKLKKLTLTISVHQFNQEYEILKKEFDNSKKEKSFLCIL